MSELHWVLSLSPYPERAEVRDSLAERIYAAIEWPLANLVHRITGAVAAWRAHRQAEFCAGAAAGANVDRALARATDGVQAVFASPALPEEREAARAMLHGRLVEASPAVVSTSAVALAAG